VSKKSEELPARGTPKVEFLEPDFARWTFASTDRDVQQAEFNYWRGWFGLEEEDEPHSMEGRVWLVRRQRR
jgi:hypothetical protein